MHVIESPTLHLRSLIDQHEYWQGVTGGWGCGKGGGGRAGGRGGGGGGGGRRGERVTGGVGSGTPGTPPPSSLAMSLYSQLLRSNLELSYLVINLPKLLSGIY